MTSSSTIEKLVRRRVFQARQRQILAQFYWVLALVVSCPVGGFSSKMIIAEDAVQTSTDWTVSQPSTGTIRDLFSRPPMKSFLNQFDHRSRDSALPAPVEPEIATPIPLSTANEDQLLKEAGIIATKINVGKDPSSDHDSVNYQQERTPQRRSRFNKALVTKGREAFQIACVHCHDEERSFSKIKSLSTWRATVRRMAAKDGADIRPSDTSAIATYLASRNGPSLDTKMGNSSQGELANQIGHDTDHLDVATDNQSIVPDISINGTISTLFRGADDNHVIENQGFFVDAWISANWQPEGPLSASVTACTSCHSDDSAMGGGGFTVELVEASATLDLIHAIKKTPAECGWEAKLKAGRFIVPFGGFAAMSHPGAYRTLTNPLMYNMGRRVLGTTGVAGPPRQPVLPMPYSDEGADLKIKVPLLPKVSATIDLYAVNGLQQSGPDLRFFFPSRSYVDNNALPAFGGRAQISTPSVQFGGSLMTGEAQFDGTTTEPILYQLSGVDVTARYQDLLRFYFEYAIRTNTRKLSPALPPLGRRTMVFGTVSEAELKLWDKPRVGLLARYDTLDFRDTFVAAPPTEPQIERFTWGFNFTLGGGSLLMLNHERWILPDPEEEVDVLGFRWVGTF